MKLQVGLFGKAKEATIQVEAQMIVFRQDYKYFRETLYWGCTGTSSMVFWTPGKRIDGVKGSYHDCKMEAPICVAISENKSEDRKGNPVMISSSPS
jgi:hypothetical protein